MEPVTLGLGLAGLAMQIFGGLGASSSAHEIAGVQQGIAADEQKINAQKQQQAQLEAQRMNLEQIRNAQRLGAQATAAATSQGAQFGSGLAGGLGQISDQAYTNMQGVNQNLEIGQNIFGINNDISSKKQQLAGLQGQQATDQGIASLGGALIKSGPVIGQLGQQASSWGKGLTGFSGPYV